MFWDRYVEECKYVGKKPNPVAKELGLSSGTVTGWKTGSVPNTKALNLLSNYFGVSVDYLLCRTDDRNPKEAPPVDEAKEANSTLVELARNCPEEKADLMLRLMQTVLQDEKKE